MNTAQVYDAGVRAALALAEAVADRIAAQPGTDLRCLSVVEALRGLAADGRALLTVPEGLQTTCFQRGDELCGIIVPSA